jgi:poly(A) polymerase
MTDPDTDQNGLHEERLLYGGRWIASIGNRIIGQGGTPEQALHAAKASRFKETPEISYVPMARPIIIHPILERIVPILPRDLPVYVVGGAVRDALLGVSVHDLDFVVPEKAIEIARKIANVLNGSFYALDKDRDYGRAILSEPDSTRLVIDFTAYKGANLEEDLRGRDFTINAMAIEVRHPQELLDPLGGKADLYHKRLLACTAKAFIEDPIRILRCVRQAFSMDLNIPPETREQLRSAVHLLTDVSAERLRDELFHILEGPHPAAALRALDILAALHYVLPELSEMKGLEQPPPHHLDAWEHSLGVVDQLEKVLAVLQLTYDPEISASLFMGIISHRLGRYREQLDAHLQTLINQDRSLKTLMLLAALYHDTGKPRVKKIDQEDRIRFVEHEKVGAEIIMERGNGLQLSNPEIDRLRIIVRSHMRPLYLTQTGKLPSRRAAFRFFRDTGSAGVDVCLLSLADTLATFGQTLPTDYWAHQVEVVRSLLETWWEKKSEVISPPAVVNGDDLILEFGLKPGQIIGQLLEAILEAQATGQVDNRRQALELASELLSEMNEGKPGN